MDETIERRQGAKEQSPERVPGIGAFLPRPLRQGHGATLYLIDVASGQSQNGPVQGLALSHGAGPSALYYQE